MKKQMVVLFTTLLLISAKAQKIDSRIAEVTVFQQGAQVTREATVNVKPGINALVFHRLTQNMDPNSVQLEGEGNLTIISITHRNNFLTEEEKSEEMISLENQIDKLDHELEKIAAAENGLVLEREILEANRSMGGTTGYTLQELRGVADFAKQRREANANEWYRLQNKKEEINKQRSKLQQQLNQEKQHFSQKTGQVEVVLDATAEGKAVFRLTYQVHNAGWLSTYDARVSSLEQPVKLTHKARITQQTGEDWEDVELTLATGNPSAGAQVPYMAPWNVTVQNVQQIFYEDKQPRSRNSFDIAETAAEDEAAPAIGFQNFQVSQNITQQEYSVARKQNIPSSSAPATVVLRHLDLDAKYEYHAKPRLDKDAFLVAKVYDWAQYDLLNGELSLFNNNTYVGKAFLNVENPEDTLQLSLGRDKGIVVTRNRVIGKQEKTLFGNNRIDHYTWKIEVRNNKRTAVDLILRDQVPVSRSEEIKVTVSDVGGGNYDENSGIISWKLSLPPASGQSRSISYEVKYPKHINVTYY